MAGTFNYFSHQQLTPNYITGIKGEFENVSGVTSSADCTAVLEAGNNIMFTGNMAQVDWSATNEVPRKDMTWKTGASMSDLHYFNGHYTTLNLQAGTSAMRPLLFDAAYGSNVNAVGGADITNINFTGSGTALSPTVTGDEIATKPYTFQGTGFETFIKHAGEMAIVDTAPGVQDPTIGDTTDGFGTLHMGYEQYDHMSMYVAAHKFSASESYRAISHGGQSPDYVSLSNCTVAMVNGTRTMSNSNGVPGAMFTTRSSAYYYVSSILADSSSHRQVFKGDCDKLHVRNCVVAGYTDSASNHNEPSNSYMYAKGILSGFQFLEMESSVGNRNTNHDGGGIGSAADDALIVASSIEMESTDATGDAVRILSAANDNVVYGLNIHSNNTSYGDVLDEAGDGTAAGNNSST
tara:strand:+ start:756 stop:1976 length:1221 start_codon:yes stop_codon:yes gene_type:complete